MILTYVIHVLTAMTALLVLLTLLEEKTITAQGRRKTGLLILCVIVWVACFALQLWYALTQSRPLPLRLLVGCEGLLFGADAAVTLAKGRLGKA